MKIFLLSWGIAWIFQDKDLKNTPFKRFYGLENILLSPEETWKQSFSLGAKMAACAFACPDLVASSFLKSPLRRYQQELSRGAFNGEFGLQHWYQGFRLIQRYAQAFVDKKTTSLKLGRDLATTKGFVVYKSPYIELLYYPVCEKSPNLLQKCPILVIPSWINKYYLLDLEPKNSWILPLVQKGFPVFVISWRNPNGEISGGFRDYVHQAWKAFQWIQNQMDYPWIHGVSYCAGGLILNALQALLQQRQCSFQSLTYMNSFFDTSYLGIWRSFLLSFPLMPEQGNLSGKTLQGLFRLLKPKEECLEYMLKKYLELQDVRDSSLGFWSQDTMNMTWRLYKDVVELFLKNNFLMKKGLVKWEGQSLSFENVGCPAWIVASEKDHLCPWPSVYAGKKRFEHCNMIMTPAGHISGILQPLHKKPKGYWHQSQGDSWSWHPVSWWPQWWHWLETHSPNCERNVSWEVLGKAPGSYALEISTH